MAGAWGMAGREARDQVQFIPGRCSRFTPTRHNSRSDKTFRIANHIKHIKTVLHMNSTPTPVPPQIYPDPFPNNLFTPPPPTPLPHPPFLPAQQFRLKSDTPWEPVRVPAGNNWQNLAKSTPSPPRPLPSARERTPAHLAPVRKYLSVDPARMALPELLMPQFQTGRVYGADNEVEKGGEKEQNPNTCCETKQIFRTQSSKYSLYRLLLKRFSSYQC